MYQNYIFDLYGTLVDIHTDEEKILFWEKMSYYFNLRGCRFRPQGLKDLYHNIISEKVCAAEGRGRVKRGDAVPEIDVQDVFYEIYARQGLVVSDVEIAGTALAFRAFSTEYIRLFPGAVSLLKEIKQAGRNIYLLSNAQALFTIPELHMLGLNPYFDGILLSSDAGIKKPDVEFYRMLLERFRLDPSKSVMIGNDDLADCHGAANAGLDSMYLHTPQSPQRRRPLPENCRQIMGLNEAAGLVVRLSGDTFHRA